jgi:signal transduction histidine kinase
MRTDAFNKQIPIDIPKEQEEQYFEILVANAIRFFRAGGTVTLDAWCDLTIESQDALIEAQNRIAQAILAAQEEPETVPEPAPEVKQEATK